MSMAGIGSTTQSAVPGTNVPPVSFPGIASGMDYNSIILKLTAADQVPITQYNNKISAVTAQNSELIKINGLLASLQNALSALSQPSAFSSYTGTSSAPSVATATGLPSASATPGSYTINATQLATATTLLGTVSSAIGFTMNNTIANATNPAYNGLPAHSVPLAYSYAAITPTNGTTGTQGKITVDGVQVSYDVGSDSVDAVLTRVQSAIRTAHPGSDFTATYNATTDSVSFTSTTEQISIGSPSDSGNLASVLKLDTAYVNNTSPTHSVTSTGGIGGVSLGASLNNNYNANFRTAVTSGTFTINGVQISVNAAKDNLYDVLNRINSSAAGVTATYDTQTGRISLTDKQTGAQSISVGGASDTSNFLTAAGLTAGAGATINVGQQASVTIQQPGGPRTYYSNSNSIQNAIPGIAINVAASTTTPFTIVVAQDTTQAVGTINTFVSAYNAAMNEMNNALAAPVVQSNTSAQSTSGSTTGTSATLASGGSLYGNMQLEMVRDQLINIVSGYVTNGSYSSLSTVGLKLDSSFGVLQANSSTSTSSSSSSSSTSGPITTQTYSGTSGQLQPLDVNAFTRALTANPQQVANLFNGTRGIVTQLGTYLTSVTGQPTSLATGLAGTIPTVSLMQGMENSNTDQITSLQQYVKTLTDKMNAEADHLRQEFSSTEGLIAQYQSLQGQLGQLTQNFNNH